MPKLFLAKLDCVLGERRTACLEILKRSGENEVIMGSTGGSDPVITVNGIGYIQPRTINTNSALLVNTTFSEPFHEPIAYGKYLARLANILSGSVLVQRLGDLMDGHRSTQARLKNNTIEPSLKASTPGDLSFTLPFHYLKSIVEMHQAMDKLVPGVASPYTLLYGIEVKFYSSQLKLSGRTVLEGHRSW